MDNRQIKEAAALYESGLSLKAVGELLGITKTTVQQALIMAGITLRLARRISSKGRR
jgi:predicted transcriptional regulator